MCISQVGYPPIAQRLVRGTHNPEVAGSNPAGRTMKKTIIIFTCSISLVVLWTLIFKCSLDVIVPTAIAFVSWILDKYLTEAFTVNANGASSWVGCAS